MLQFFRSINLMQIFVGILGEGASNDSGVIENVDFSAFGRYIVGTLCKKAEM